MLYNPHHYIAIMMHWYMTYLQYMSWCLVQRAATFVIFVFIRHGRLLHDLRRHKFVSVRVIHLSNGNLRYLLQYLDDRNISETLGDRKGCLAGL